MILFIIFFFKEGEEYGLTQTEMNQSIETLLSIGKKLNVAVNLLRNRRVDDISDKTNAKSEAANENKENSENANNYKYVNEYLMRKKFEEDDFIEVRVAVVGNVDAGKSTLLGKIKKRHSTHRLAIFCLLSSYVV